MARVKKKYRASIFYVYLLIYVVYGVGLLSGFWVNLPVVGPAFATFHSIVKSSGMTKLMSFVTMTCVLYYYQKGKNLEDKEIKENKVELKKQYERDKREFNKMVENPFKSFEEIIGASDDVVSEDSYYQILNNDKTLEKKESDDEKELAVPEKSATTEETTESEDHVDVLYEKGEMKFF